MPDLRASLLHQFTTHTTRSGRVVMLRVRALVTLALVSTTHGFECNDQVGLVAPLPLCNQSIAPIEHCLGPGAEIVQVPGINNISRPYCRVTPVAAHTAPVPLVLFFHGAFGSADDVLERTNLLNASRSWVWSNETGTGSVEGFVLVVPSGACLQWNRTGSHDGYHWDNYHRNLSSPSSNPDVALADAIVDAEVARGNVDPSRVFVMGWSNGGFFGQMYSVARTASRGTPTPGGTHVAAASVYTAGDTFNNMNADTFPSCKLNPYPLASGAQLMITSNNCDLVACDAQQGAELDAQSDPNIGRFSSPGFDVALWVSNSSSLIGAAVRWDLIDARTRELTTGGCLHGSRCWPLKATLAHSSWPSGRLSDMLSFLDAAHPIPSSPPPLGGYSPPPLPPPPSPPLLPLPTSPICGSFRSDGSCDDEPGNSLRVGAKLGIGGAALVLIGAGGCAWHACHRRTRMLEKDVGGKWMDPSTRSSAAELTLTKAGSAL